MTPQDRIKRYSRIAGLGAVAVWILLCFFIVLSPRLRRSEDLRQRVAASSGELTAMRKEIEDARIIGGPAPGGARFDKFGILSTDEEQLFLSDLIAFCKETTNTLNLVRRSEFSRAASPAPEQGKQGQPAAGRPQTGAGPSQPPQPVILRVPHTVSFNGSFVSAFYLLRKLESYRRLLTVERMDLTIEQQVGYPQINGNITIELYLVKQPVTSTTAQASAAVPAS